MMYVSVYKNILTWRDRWESNPQPKALEASAQPIELLSQIPLILKASRGLGATNYSGFRPILLLILATYLNAPNHLPVKALLREIIAINAITAYRIAKITAGTKTTHQLQIKIPVSFNITRIAVKTATNVAYIINPLETRIHSDFCKVIFFKNLTSIKYWNQYLFDIICN